MANTERTPGINRRGEPAPSRPSGRLFNVMWNGTGFPRSFSGACTELQDPAWSACSVLTNTASMMHHPVRWRPFS